MTNEALDEQPWYAVRCIFRSSRNQPWGPHDLGPGESDYEERITLWHAASFEQAVERAEAEAREVAETVGSEYLGLAQAFHLFDANPGNGSEVYSLIRRSSLDGEEYLNRFFDTGTERQRPPAK